MIIDPKVDHIIINRQELITVKIRPIEIAT
jgi:hypothetical protein